MVEVARIAAQPCASPSQTGRPTKRCWSGRAAVVSSAGPDRRFRPEIRKSSPGGASAVLPAAHLERGGRASEMRVAQEKRYRDDPGVGATEAPQKEQPGRARSSSIKRSGRQVRLL